MSPRHLVRVQVDPTPKLVMTTLRADEVATLEHFAQVAGVRRAAYLRAVLRGARPNPIAAFWAKLDPGAEPPTRHGRKVHR